MKAVTEITLPERLKHLVRYCEKFCVADCCGIDAFDFSPLQIASFLSSSTWGISKSEIAEWNQELAKAEELTRDLAPNKEGYICSVAGTNQYFRREEFRAFIAELRHSIQVSPQIFELSEQLRYRQP